MLGSYQAYLDLIANAPPCIPVVVEPYGADAMAAAGETPAAPRRIFLTGERGKLEKLARECGLPPTRTEIVHCESTPEAVAAAASLVLSNEADFVVKGSLPTASLLKGLLGRGQLGLGRVASHLYLIDSPAFPDRTIAVADAGVNIAPDLTTKADIVRNSVSALLALGVTRPLVAALSAVEVVKPAMASTVDAALLAAMSARRQFGAAVVDGPMSLDLAMSKTAAVNKALTSEVAGQADLLIAPHIDAANMTSKALIGAHGRAMGVVLGCSAPIALPSRGDTLVTRVHSLLLASFLAQHASQGEAR